MNIATLNKHFCHCNLRFSAKVSEMKPLEQILKSASYIKIIKIRLTNYGHNNSRKRTTLDSH